MINKCIDCRKNISKFAKRCRSCASKGLNHSQWKGGHSLQKSKCIDCGTLIDYRSQRCKICSNKYNAELKLNVHNYKDTCKCGACRATRGEYKGKNNPMHGVRRFGSANPCFRGWKTKLYQLIRTSPKYNEWRAKVYERDTYTCQECGFDGGRILEAHHIEPFAIILDKFLKTYSHLSPLEDKEELLKLAKTFKLFWNVKNGITLCQNCHSSVKKATLEAINAYQQI